MQQSAKFLFISLVVLAATYSNAANISSSKSKFVTTTTPDPDEEFDQGDPFQYSYAVEAEPTVNETRVRQSKAESSDGQEVVGQYKVLLPDGRLQTVSYTSGPNGYKATVKYVQVGVENPALVVSSSTESNGRSFTVSRTRTTSPTTTTTTSTTTTTTTSAPMAVQEPVDDRREKQRQQTEPIDSRTSSSSRSRQRSNRTRGGGERFRSPQETAAMSASAAAASVAGKMTSDLTMMTAVGQTDDATRIDSTVSRFKSSPPSFGMKMSRRFDGKRTDDFN
ncbi:mucin-5AC-like [Daphnia pulex]|uniref:mucin-5AC-like n=1 Tax=Daphnia pulex TaxID=6669 RepID=UPI001EDCB76F|nr:mucin-5AC-like [Daphnia pulex]